MFFNTFFYQYYLLTKQSNDLFLDLDAKLCHIYRISNKKCDLNFAIIAITVWYKPDIAWGRILIMFKNLRFPSNLEFGVPREVSNQSFTYCIRIQKIVCLFKCLITMDTRSGVSDKSKPVLTEGWLTVVSADILRFD